MRHISELLQLLLNNMDKFYEGLCQLSKDIRKDDVITSDEFHTLLEYIDDGMNMEDVCWPYLFIPGKAEPRIKWLEERIELTK